MDVRMMVRAALFAALTAVGAFIRIPIGDLSVTLQVMFSLMAGLILKEKWGSISQMMYILCGLVGIPVFTGGGGPQYVLQPSFGFIMGLVLLAYISGRFVRKNFSIKNCIIGCVLGLLALYAIGLPYMYIAMNFYMGNAVSFLHIMVWGMLVYLPFDARKICIAIFASLKLNTVQNLQT